MVRRLIQDLPERQRYRAYIRLAILAVAAASTYAFAVLLQEEAYWWALIPGAVLGLLSVAEFVLVDIYVDSRFPRETTEFLERLERKLATTTTHDEILATLTSCVDSFAACDKGRITSAVHVTIDLVEAGTARTTKGLVQISDYTRHDLGGRRWRVLKATQGIVGRCVRAGRVVWVNFPTLDEYTRRMVEDFGFTDEEAKGHTKAARSYLAVPIFNNSEDTGALPHDEATRSRKPIGIMYFFSTEAQVFPKAVDSDVLEHHANDVAALLRASGIIRQEWLRHVGRDTNLEERQHELMHTIGRWTRKKFGCQLEFDGATYFENLPDPNGASPHGDVAGVRGYSYLHDLR